MMNANSEVCSDATFLMSTQGELDVLAPLEGMKSAEFGADWDFTFVLIDHKTCLPLGTINGVAKKLDPVSAANIELVHYQLKFMAEEYGFVPQGVMHGMMVMPPEDVAIWKANVTLDDGGYFAQRQKENGEVFFYNLYQSGRIIFYF